MLSKPSPLEMRIAIFLEHLFSKGYRTDSVNVVIMALLSIPQHLPAFHHADPFLQVSMVLLAAVVSMMILWRLWTFTVKPYWKPDEPRELPYWIPCKPLKFESVVSGPNTSEMQSDTPTDLGDYHRKKFR